MKGFATIAAVLFLAGCAKAPPPHYVLCEGKDYNGWKLIDTDYTDEGYLVACTYQAPDLTGIYTARCTDDGCD